MSLMVVAVSAFASYIPLGALAGKLGRKKVIGIVGSAVGVNIFR